MRKVKLKLQTVETQAGASIYQGISNHIGSKCVYLKSKAGGDKQDRIADFYAHSLWVIVAIILRIFNYLQYLLTYMPLRIQFFHSQRTVGIVIGNHRKIGRQRR